MNITGVILAAGTSSRMGSFNKLLLKYNNHTIIEEVLEQLSNSKVDSVVIITGFENTRIEGLLACSLTHKVRCVYNGRYRLGRAESIRCAIEHIAGEADAALFMVADKPGVTTALIDKAIDRFKQDQPAILFVETPTGRGHPILFSKRLFGDLLQLRGDCVGDELVAKYRYDLIRLKDEKEQIDVDSQVDYLRLTGREVDEKTA